MSHAGYVLGAWGIAFSAGAGYAIYVIHRGRQLAARVDPSRRRWMTTSSESSMDANTPTSSQSTSDSARGASALPADQRVGNGK